MADDARKARDLALLDAIDAAKRESFAAPVWRVVRAGRDPLLGARSHTRWCNAGFDVLYTALEADGACAEIHSFLSSQPVFPSKFQARLHRLGVQTTKTLRLPDLKALAILGVDVARYRQREYQRSQEIADAAYFLGFDSLLVPSARWPCLNLVLFTDRIEPAELRLEHSAPEAIDWAAWKKARGKP